MGHLYGKVGNLLFRRVVSGPSCVIKESRSYHHLDKLVKNVALPLAGKCIGHSMCLSKSIMLNSLPSDSHQMLAAQEADTCYQASSKGEETKYMEKNFWNGFSF